MLKFIILIILIILCILFRNLENKCVFVPDTTNILPLKKVQKQINLKLKEGYVNSKNGGILHYLHYCNPNSEKIILFAHGNAGNIYNRIHFIQLFSEMSSVIIFDYQGYGKSIGTPSEENVYSDILNMWKYIKKTLRYKPKNIVLFGESLGCSAVSWLGSYLCDKKDKPKLIIMQSGFSSLKDIVSDICPTFIYWIFKYKFENINYVKKIGDKIPILIIHSPQDEIININHAAKLILANKNIFFYRINGTHNNPEINEKYFEILKKLMS